MSAPPINVRFDLVSQLSNMDGVLLRRQNLWQVPLVGEIVSIGGYPYRVIARAWSLPDVIGDPMSLAPPESHGAYAQFAYVKVQKASSFTVHIGSKAY
jgi:hypothetical protein